MDAFVADCSITIAWSVESQASPSTDDLLARVASGMRIVVPTIWPFEMANALTSLVRRKRITANDSAAAASALGRLNPIVDDEGHRVAMGETLALAIKCSLSVYDAAYLELARRRGLPLSTRDGALHAAARKMKVRTLIDPSR